jgi:hypothetical protein
MKGRKEEKTRGMHTKMRCMRKDDMIENESKNKANETGSNWTTSKERRKEMQT